MQADEGALDETRGTEGGSEGYSPAELHASIPLWMVIWWFHIFGAQVSQVGKMKIAVWVSIKDPMYKNDGCKPKWILVMVILFCARTTMKLTAILLT